MPYAVPWSEMNSFVPRLDPIGPRHRIDLEGPLVGAYLGGRPVILARTDPSRPGIQRTVPITISRFRHAIDLEQGRDGYWDGSTPIDDVPLGDTGAAIRRTTDLLLKEPSLAVRVAGVGALVGVAIAALRGKSAKRGAVAGALAAVPLLYLFEIWYDH